MNDWFEIAWQRGVQFLWNMGVVCWHIFMAILQARREVKNTTYNGPEDER